MDDEEHFADAQETILLHYTHGKIYSWDAEDVSKLRETHHIIGTLVGSLVRSPRQNLQHGLPLQLLPEEAAVLLEYDVAKLVKLKPLKVTPEMTKDFNDHRQQTFEEQKAIMKTEREERLRQIADVIDAGRVAKKRKLEEQGAEKSLKDQETSAKTQRLISEDTEEMALDLSTVKVVSTETSPPEPATATATAMPSVPVDDVSKIETQEEVNEALDLTTAKRNVAMDTAQVPFSERAESCSTKGSSDPWSNVSRKDLHTQNQIASSELMLKEGGIESENVAKLMESIQKAMDAGGNVTDNSVCTVGDDNSVCVSSYKESSAIEEEMTSSASTSRQGSERSVDVERLGGVDVSQNTCSDGLEAVTCPPKVVEQHKEKKQAEHFNLQACMVQIPTVSPYSRYEEMTSWNFPSSEHERLRFHVFKHFWEKGYYLTTGGKFGGDFLIYPGDPFLFHSYYVAVCLPFAKKLSALDVVAYGRLASNVKKTVLLCSLNENDEVVHTSVQWTGIN
ncbi:tRNA-splicing endonuclease subunit Sen34-like [Ptychodera flava]|uniref:tRNA-splicing endonuclease subunit Sen34-like n=1 Tax=Ptychodera flava TaxID=63121 RepID=UPI00396A15CA